MAYEWDEDKNRLNIAQHGIAFTEADRFEWGRAVFEIDDREDYDELREVATGFLGDVLHVIVFTERGPDIIRIISLRKATKREQKIYADNHQI